MCNKKGWIRVSDSLSAPKNQCSTRQPVVGCVLPLQTTDRLQIYRSRAKKFLNWVQFCAIFRFFAHRKWVQNCSYTQRYCGVLSCLGFHCARFIMRIFVYNYCDVALYYVRIVRVMRNKCILCKLAPSSKWRSICKCDLTVCSFCQLQCLYRILE